MLDEVSNAVASKSLRHPVRVCIDGADGAGKTVLADELAARVGELGRATIRASIDGFHRPSGERYARYGQSPEGYYRDSFDYEALRDVLLEPLGPNGDLEYRVAMFDFRTDEPIVEEWTRAERDAVLLFDGVFLLRPQLRDSWDLSIYLRVGWDEVLRRVVARDSSWMGPPKDVRERYLTRYIPGQRLYHDEASPEDVADIVIDNSNFSEPELIRGLGPGREP